MNALPRIGLWVFGLIGVALGQTGRLDDRLEVATWRYTMTEPGAGWMTADLDDSGWSQGPGGFGERSTPGSRVGTEWQSSDIWIRREVAVEELPESPALLIHHDEDAEVYLNGRRVAALTGYTTEYRVVPLDEAGREALKVGANLLAAHCHQTRGGQYIDVYVVDGSDVPRLPARQPFPSQLRTRWGREVTAENAWTEYPRPQLTRPTWRSLNGRWDYAVTLLESPPPEEWDGQILVPFALESQLSGVRRLLEPEEALWYRRTFEAEEPETGRLLLHFEAVDYRCRAWVNGRDVGGHVGGNLPFSFDITDAVRSGENELIVRVEDRTGGAQLRGKQRLEPGGIWYTRVSGIWQTVWLEEVPARYIERLHVTSELPEGILMIQAELAGRALEGEVLRAVVLDGDQTVAEATGDLTLAIPEPHLWSPDDPHLYDLEIALLDGEGEVIDEVGSYAGLRAVGTARDADGNLRLTLNGEVIFHWGTLDQGWWPDGLLTPPSDEAMRFDIEFLKRAGFNMVRKHIKVEPRRYYAHCDRIGLLVWQDQVSGGPGPRWTRLAPNPSDAEWEDADHRQYRVELKGMVDTLGSSPSIVVWVPFNEAWGQHRTLEIGRWLVAYDPTRLVNVASGGNFWPVGHIADHHAYPEPAFPIENERFADYVRVVGEFGGHGWPVEDHLWNASRGNWGYGGLPDSLEELEQRYRASIRRLAELKAQGIAAGVYTQTTDVEEEINGLLTYDRAVEKIPAEKLREIHQILFAEQ